MFARGCGGIGALDISSILTCLPKSGYIYDGCHIIKRFETHASTRLIANQKDTAVRKRSESVSNFVKSKQLLIFANVTQPNHLVCEANGSSDPSAKNTLVSIKCEVEKSWFLWIKLAKNF